MKRKDFLKSVSVASAASVILPNTFLDAKPISTLPSIKPPRLKKGDTIGLVTPGSYISEKERIESIESLESLGFRVVYSDKLMKKNGYFSASDEERAEDLNNMFKRDDVDAVVCARGGYGCTRILPLLDYELISVNPKILLGYSDVTALLYGIYKKTGLITFHGPVGISSYNTFTYNYFDKVLMNPEMKLVLKNSDGVYDDNPYGIRVLSEGKGKGKLIGGNLSIVSSLIGTSYDINTNEKILFLEEIGEEPYQIDRMLTQLIQAGKFENVGGVALGIFRRCEQKKTDPSFSSSFSLMEVLQDRLSGLDVPVVYGMSFGHLKDKFTIPFGVEAEFDSQDQTITMLERAVL